MDERNSPVRRGLNFSILTVAWNVVEGVVAAVSGVAAASIVLLGFGIESHINPPAESRRDFLSPKR